MNQSTLSFEMKNTDDIHLISHYPIEYAREAFVLIRRLAYLKLMTQKVSPSQSEVFDDVRDLQDLVTNLIKSKGISVSEYINFYHPQISLESRPFEVEDEDE
jgi:hypothetical protein